MKVTIYSKSEFMGNIIATETRLKSFTFRKYAQYPNALENYWHTTKDTPDKCSAESLEAVGTVISTLIYNEDK